jgi:PAS domain S-box-containing protein
MRKNPIPQIKPAPVLRKMAEAALRATRTDVAKLAAADVQRLVSELQVHQIELEMQNEELRRTQAELAVSRDRFNDLYDYAPVGYLTLDEGGTVIEANLTAAKMLGVERDKLVGRKFTAFVARSAQDALYLHRRAGIASEEKHACDLELRRKDGTTFSVRMETVGFRDAESGAPYFRSALIDITERKQVEQALAFSHAELESRVVERTADLHDREGRLRAILNTVVDAVITIDHRGVINSMNPATERMFGYGEAELLGRNLSMLMPAPYRQEHDQYLGIYHRTGKARMIGMGCEAQGLRKDGSVFPIELAMSKIDHLDMFTGVIRDMTERKRLEAEVLRIAEEERLRVAADLHDGICQELVGIQYSANILRRDLQKLSHPLAAQAKRNEEAIVITTDHTRQVARGMNPVVADGSGLMQTLRSLTETTGRTRRIRCAFECPRPVFIENPTVANELYRIAQEAIHNALRHGEAKRITVRLNETEGEVCLAVIDNGSGLPIDVSSVPGMGLRVMKYRAGVIGGNLVVQPRPRGGVEVICRVVKPEAKL